MKSTISAVALVASLLPTAFASPLNMERNAEADVDYKIVTDVQVVTAWATAYATEGAEPTVVYTAPAVQTTTTVAADTGRGKGRNRSKWTWHQDTTSTTSSTSSVAPPPPPPTTTSTTEAAPVAAPEPTTTSTSTSVEPVWTAPAYTPPTTTSTYVAPTTAYSAPATKSTPSAYTGDSAYSDANLQLAIINSTNAYRSMFQAQPLAWNQSLVDMAVASAAKCDFEHSNAGQNLAAGYSGPQAAVGGWGDEYKTFNFAKPDWSESCGHFTQLVWQDSTTTGCAAKKCPSDGSTPAQGWYLVCNYFPVGNMLGEFPENVKSKAS